ncbi:MAG: hypothetical protein IPJ00_11285 [Saprospirales bacterium]|nr:hypothetical protein [Saprospirales bacterium]
MADGSKLHLGSKLVGNTFKINKFGFKEEEKEEANSIPDTPNSNLISDTAPNTTGI